jgi:parallel beta-helix repeat protein
MKRSARLLTAAAVLMGTAIYLAEPARAATTYVVDDDGSATPTNCSPAVATPAPTSINLAITGASDGDTIKVCPGVYDESVLINKQLTVRGAKAGVNGATRVFNAATESIISVFTECSVCIDADGVVFDGFTVRDGYVGIAAGYATPISGYIVRNNIVKNNALGMQLNSDGDTPVTVSRNKVLANNKTLHSGTPLNGAGWGILGGYYGVLENATISGNFIGQQHAAGILLVSCAGSYNDDVTVTSNTFKNNYVGVRVANNNTDVTITKNNATDDMAANDGDWGPAVHLALNNTDIVIGGSALADGNTLDQSPAEGILVKSDDLCSAAVLPSGGVSIKNNTVSGSNLDAIMVTDNVTGPIEVSGNTVTNALVDGIHFFAGTFGNVISGNTVSGSGNVDCLDFSTGGAAGPPNYGTQNQWTGNTGATMNVTGICTPPT